MCRVLKQPDAVPGETPTRPHRRRDIQGLRAIAVAVVVAFHAGLPLPGGFLGVDVFFVISGFVITLMLHREWTASGRIAFGAFYARRFKRLTPALALMVTVVVGASIAFQSPLGGIQVTAETALGALLLCANFVIALNTGGYFDSAAESNPLLNTWSLSVEEQFYLVFPLILLIGWLVARRYGRLRWAVTGLVAVVTLASLAVALAYAAGLTIPHVPVTLLGFYSPVTRAWEFGAGALLALALRERHLASRGVQSALGLVGVALIAVSVFVISGDTPTPGRTTLLPVVGALLVILAGSGLANPVSGVLGTQPFVWLGDRSYSWYLWHWPFIVFAALLFPGRPWVLIAAAALSLVPSVLSFTYVEQPIHALRNVSRRRLARIVTLTMVPAIGIAAIVYLAASHAFWSPTVRDLQAATQMHAGQAAGCLSEQFVGDRDVASCTWNAGATGTPVYLVGDSNADHLSEAVIGAATATDRPVTIVTRPSCPFVDVYVAPADDPSAWDVGCHDHVTSMLAWLAAQPAGLVVVSDTDSYWFDPVLTVGRSPELMEVAATEKLSVFQAGVSSVAEQLAADGHETLLVQTIPHFTGEFLWDPLACSLWESISGSCSQTRPLHYPGDPQAAVSDALSGTTLPSGATVIDESATVCPDDLCSTERGDVVLYRDPTHLSVAGSGLLVDDLTNVFSAAS